MATVVRNCSYGHATGTGRDTSVHAGVDVNFLCS